MFLNSTHVLSNAYNAIRSSMSACHSHHPPLRCHERTTLADASLVSFQLLLVQTTLCVPWFAMFQNPGNDANLSSHHFFLSVSLVTPWVVLLELVCITWWFWWKNYFICPMH